jgi:hypothetical protein
MRACLKRGGCPFHHGLGQHDRRRRPVPGLPVRLLDDVLRVAGPKSIARIPRTVQGGEGMGVDRLHRVTCLVLDQNQRRAALKKRSAEPEGSLGITKAPGVVAIL